MNGIFPVLVDGLQGVYGGFRAFKYGLEYSPIAAERCVPASIDSRNFGKFSRENILVVVSVILLILTVR